METFVPDFVRMLTTDPEFRPYAGSKFTGGDLIFLDEFGIRECQAGALGQIVVIILPVDLLSLLLPRRPFTAKPAPLILENARSPLFTTPGR